MPNERSGFDDHARTPPEVSRVSPCPASCAADTCCSTRRALPGRVARYRLLQALEEPLRPAVGLRMVRPRLARTHPPPIQLRLVLGLLPLFFGRAPPARASQGTSHWPTGCCRLVELPAQRGHRVPARSIPTRYRVRPLTSPGCAICLSWGRRPLRCSALQADSPDSLESCPEA